MRLTVFAATLAFLLWGAPAFAGTAPDQDSDGVADDLDNCSLTVNTAQDDTDGDDCGNLCDADFDDTGVVGFPDFGEFVAAYGSTDEEMILEEPIPGTSVGFPDFGIFVALYGTTAGPSGTTAGTVRCP
jgi:hypothetical protein